MTACSALRLPALTRSLPNSPETEPFQTPTLAPLLLTPVPTPTPEPTPDGSLPSPTATFGLPLPEPTCRATPMWGLGDVWRNEAVRTRLGCPIGQQIGVQGEELHFQNGSMLSRPDAGLIYVLFERWEPLGWGAYVDTFLPSDPASDPNVIVPTPMPGQPLLLQPTGRFGKLWRENAWLRERLGWAVAIGPEVSDTAVIRFNGAAQEFERGVLFWNGNVCFVLRLDDMSWDMY